MNIHEYQSKQILKRFSISVPEGKLLEEGPNLEKRAETLSQELFQERKNTVWILKAQVHAGGRGKAGGVKVCKSISEVKKTASELMGKTLITPQTGEKGKKVHKIWIEEGAAIEKEFYFSILLDRSLSKIVLLVSSQGGMDIEAVASQFPDKIHRVIIDPALGFFPFHGRKLANALELPSDLLKEAVHFFENAYRCFLQTDSSLLEINPLVLTQDKRLLALDAKLNFDENALFRHPDILAMKDPLEENPQDLEAAQHHLAYIALDGTIGCLVNGAGLAMATMDIIKLHGGEPANFLDVGGGASKEKVSHAFQIILKDPNVKAILVNIFGGIMQCDVLALGIVEAVKEMALSVPLVVRLEGTNVEKGKKILTESGLKIIPANHLEDAAKKVVSAAKY